MRYIELSDVVGNAFFFYLEGTGRHVLKFSLIEEYGRKVVEYLNNQSNTNIFKVSPERTRAFFEENSDYFIYYENDNLVVLKAGVTVENLFSRFSKPLPLDVILAFRNEDLCKILLRRY